MMRDLFVKRKLAVAAVVLLSIISLFPFRVEMDDGGSIRYGTSLYGITRLHSLNSQAEDGYLDGWHIEILGITVYYHAE